MVDLTINFTPTPPPIIPSDAMMTGNPIFYSETFGIFADTSHLTPMPPPIDIGKGGTYIFSFAPIDPCFGDGSCRLDFSFGGFTGDFATAAFPFLLTGLDAGPTPPPILPIGFLDHLIPNGPPIDVLGQIVAFDDPVIVGTWEVTVRAVPEPGWTMMLLTFVSGLLGLAFCRMAKGPVSA